MDIKQLMANVQAIRQSPAPNGEAPNGSPKL
jgi:hypothetical protein